jgi:hypothetical protein
MATLSNSAGVRGKLAGSMFGSKARARAEIRTARAEAGIFTSVKGGAKAKVGPSRNAHNRTTAI